MEIVRLIYPEQAAGNSIPWAAGNSIPWAAGNSILVNGQMWLFCVPAPSQRSRQDRQIPFPHFSDLNLQVDSNPRCCEYALRLRLFTCEKLKVSDDDDWCGEVDDQIIWKAGEQCRDISTATEKPTHWTLLNTTPEAENSWRQLFAAMNDKILVNNQQSGKSNRLWHSLRAISCCANTHPAPLRWVMR